MIKLVIRVKYPRVSYVVPYRLSEYFTAGPKEDRLSVIDDNFKNIQRWVDAKRNYTSN